MSSISNVDAIDIFLASSAAIVLRFSPVSVSFQPACFSATSTIYRHPLVRLLWCATGAAAGISLALHLAAPPVSAFFSLRSAAHQSSSSASPARPRRNRVPCLAVTSVERRLASPATKGSARHPGYTPWLRRLPLPLCSRQGPSTRPQAPIPFSWSMCMPAGARSFNWCSSASPSCLLTAALWSRLFPGACSLPL